MELLAPAGSIAALKQAVFAKADAVYLGLDSFNARMKAENFTAQNLYEWVEYCHIFDVKVYLTLNTNVKDSELIAVSEVVKIAVAANIDAFIVTDLAVVRIIKKFAPTIPMHASTQMGVHNLLGAKFIEGLGIKRVVLSRETTLEEIREIKNNTDLEIEYFVHGSLCVSFSGGCLFSAITSGNSGNRGKCLQLCRKQYFNNINDKKGYFLSPKDQCLIEKLEQLEQVGVDSVKIEGRMKTPEYVGVVVDNYYKALHGENRTKEDDYRLKVVYNRGNFTSGYSFERAREIMFPNIQGHFGAQVGVITSVRRIVTGFLATAKMSRDIPNKSGIKFIYNGMEIDGAEIDITTNNNGNITFLIKENYPIGTVMNITFDPSISLIEARKLPITIDYNAKLNENFTISATYSDIKVEYTHEFVCVGANSNPVTHELITKQLTKLGDTNYIASSIKGNLDDNLFIPNGVLNQARREIAMLLTEKIILEYNNSKQIASYNKRIIKPSNNTLTTNIIELDDAQDIGSSEYVYVVNYSYANMSILKNSLTESNIYIKLPKLALNKDISRIMTEIKDIPASIGIYADNVYSIELAKTTSRKYIAGFGLNVFNKVAHNEYVDADAICISPELAQLETGSMNGYIYSYGYLSLMTMAHCPYQLVSGNNCGNCDYHDFEYSDRFGEYKITRTKAENCTFNLNNSVCHDLTELKIDKMYYDFRHLSSSQIKEFYANSSLPIIIKKTFGLYKRGVE